jgi:filamentous hemagglutinin family protein
MHRTLQTHSKHARLVQHLSLALGLLLFIPVPFSVSLAQTITSSGLNTSVSAPITLPGGQTQLNITGGTRAGGGLNLYHSFGNFNVPNNNIANFLNNCGLPTSNILGRVTGGIISSIFGTIQTTGFGNANLFLMNPAGFLFGPNATLNVGGMVAFTSADYIRLADDARFKAVSGSSDASLTAAPVAAFGFLGSNPAAIIVQGSHLTVAEGTGISLVGGNITVQGGSLTAPRGQINLVSVRSPSNPTGGGEVVVSESGQGSGFSSTGFRSLGTITLDEGSTIETSIGSSIESGGNPGSIFIRGGQIVVKDSTVDAFVGDGRAGAITIAATGRLDIENSRLDTTSDVGAAGMVDLQAGTRIDLAGTTISASERGVAPGGSITLAAPVISLSSSTLNVSGSNVENEPIATVSLTGTQAVKLTNGTILSADSTNPCSVCVAGTIVINGGGLFTSRQSTISARPNIGHGGAIQVNADIIRLTDTLLTTSTRVPDLPTSVGSSITIESQSLTLKNGQILSTATEGQGGKIDITSPVLHQIGSVIDASSQFGTDGTVTINGVVQP